ncbi:hypothetical protein U6G28_08790 [Actinomycetaceae bacterium MB13-C1-2]|nr:hypothetical protein U6G28_08790 [Actinomycetaceae bacterium MB13-C1-2]
MNITATVIQWLNGRPHLVAAGLEAFATVRKERPPRFITVERTGGAIDTFRDLPNLAIQVWGQSVAECEDLSNLLRRELPHLTEISEIARVSIGSTYNWPDPDTKQARWQTVISLVVAWPNP